MNIYVLLPSLGVFMATALMNSQEKKCFTKLKHSHLKITMKEAQPGTSSWLEEVLFHNSIKEKRNKITSTTIGKIGEMKDGFILDFEEQSKEEKTGHVIRTAARKYHETSSKPSTWGYTTRKLFSPFIYLTTEGVNGDYNHYRTTVLKNTPDRAVSIVTSDVMQYVQSLYPTSKGGDLGENLLLKGFEYHSIQVGTRLKIGKRGVLLEITEPMEPCANLCTLPYINNAGIEPKLRLKNCQDFLFNLAKFDGLRGRYAKVVTGGRVGVGETVFLV
mmetsp:Transcript_27372/g.41431  ORF Transcript_27372/g.41431 Transcript_27372/m.41431 type:complete len:274 (+) Transcript_27372:259-1080(+)